MTQLKKYKLGQLVDVTRGASLAGEYYATSGKYIRLTCGNFDYVNNCFKINTSKDDLFYNGPIREEFIMKRGDIITPLTEQAIGLLGSTAIIPNDDLYIQSQDVAKISCNTDILDSNYAFYLVSSDLVKHQLSVAAQQTKIRHTSPDKIKDCSVWIPDMKEQRNIGSFLASIDSKITLNRRMNTTLEAVAKQLYDYWFVQFDFPNAEGKAYKSSGGKMVWNEKLKREIPEGWEVKMLNETTKNEMDSVNPYDNPDVLYKHFSIPSYDLCESYTYEKGSDILSNKFILTSKDVIVSKLNPWTSRVIWGQDLENSICSTEFVSLAPNDIKEKGFIYFLAKSQPFIAYCTKASTGTSHSHRRVNPDLLRMYSFPYDKETIIKYSEIVGNYAEKMISNLEEISKLTTLRDYLLPLLMNGQVTIKE